jgi:hypothetical protein
MDPLGNHDQRPWKIRPYFFICCGCWDVYPGSLILIFNPSRIPDFGSQISDPKQQQRRGVNKIVVIPFFGTINLTKYSQKYLGSGIWDPKKTYSASVSRGQKGTGFQIWIPHKEKYFSKRSYRISFFKSL